MPNVLGHLVDLSCKKGLWSEDVMYDDDSYEWGCPKAYVWAC